MSTKRMVWTIVYRNDSKSPQEEIQKYTAEAANTYAKTVIEQGGLAMVFEGDEDLPEEDIDKEPQFTGNKGTLQW